MRLIDLTGRQFGFWTVRRRAKNRDVCGKSRVFWECECACGKIKEMFSGLLLSGHTKSCGCKRPQFCRDVNLKHGLSNTYIENCRLGMVRRCYSPKDKAYHNYGGRGIRVCEWLSVSTEHLFQLVGHRPTPRHTIHRIDNDANYSCGSCRECLRCGWERNIAWATPSEQGRAKRNNRLVTIDGVTRCATEWRQILGLSRAAFEWRYMPDKKKYFEKLHTAEYWRRWRKQKKEQVPLE